MAPITDEVVDGLKSTIGKLEARIEDLESRLPGGGAKPKSVTEQMRLILMGPPGAGTLGLTNWLLESASDPETRQGYPGPEHQGEVLCLPPGKPSTFGILMTDSRG